MQHTIFVIVLAAALSLGVFAVSVQRGAMLVYIDRLTALMSLIWGGISLIMVCAGYGAGKWILLCDLDSRDMYWIHVVCGLCLAVSGARMFYRALRRKTFIERRMEKVDMKHDSILCLRITASTFVAGIVCGLLEAGIVRVILAFFFISTGSAVFGYMNGRSNGPVWSDKAYLLGGTILCAAGIMLQIA